MQNFRRILFFSLTGDLFFQNIGFAVSLVRLNQNLVLVCVVKIGKFGIQVQGLDQRDVKKLAEKALLLETPKEIQDFVKEQIPFIAELVG